MRWLVIAVFATLALSGCENREASEKCKHALVTCDTCCQEVGAKGGAPDKHWTKCVCEGSKD